ncbi:MAG: APC family permease, partial [Alphaproteobacteria bacterium]
MNENGAVVKRPRPGLKRTLSLPMITLYGLGTTIGGGIYVLVGTVAGRAGLYAPLSFVLAAILATFLALTFAELSSRFPKSAGEAVYVSEGLGLQSLATLVGILVVIAGTVSAAALSNGFSGYFRVFLAVPPWLAIVGIATVLGLLAAWGIGQAVALASIITVVEIGGLGLVIWAGADALATLPSRASELLPPFSTVAWGGILSGSFLAFYAFIGFEDMVNVAEEVKNVRRNLPRAIVLTLGITTIIYFLVTLVAVLALPPDQLAASSAPLALVVSSQTGGSGRLISVIGIFAVLNGALIQIIMASRVLYGMAVQGWIPVYFGRINRRTGTPLQATFWATVMVAILALGFNVEILAQATTLAVILVAILVNASLWRLKRRGPPPAGTFVVPMFVPIAGFAVSILFGTLVVM